MPKCSSSDNTQTSLISDFFNSGSYLAASTADHVPNNYSQAMASDKPSQWQLAVNKEIASLDKNDLFVSCSLPVGRKAFGSRWVFTEKVLADGSIMEKARLFPQIDGVDCGNTFAPVAKLVSLRIMLSTAASSGMEIHNMDVNSAFLLAPLEGLFAITRRFWGLIRHNFQTKVSLVPFETGSSCLVF